MPSVSGHAHYRELLERHIDGELAPQEREQLFTHLETCAECLKTLEAEERLTERLRQVPRLVAPSALRAKILQQVLSEQQDRKTPLVADARFQTILRPDTDGSNLEAAEGVVAEDEDLPVFPSVPRPRPSRMRAAWRRASPRVATAFLCVSAVAALVTGDFTGMPLAQSLQTAVFGAARNVTALAGLADPQPPIPIPDPLPEPAEKAHARIAALVLIPTDKDLARFGFEPDNLGEALRQHALTQLRGPVETDQFAYDGHRYRTYVVDLPDDQVEQMMLALKPYQTAPRESILRGLSMQAGGDPKTVHAAFFSSRSHDLQSALASLSLEEPGRSKSQKHPLQIVVVE